MSRQDADVLLDVQSLHVRLPQGSSHTNLVENVSFRIHRAERVALVGESGSGKSVTARALMRLSPRLQVDGRVMLDGGDLLGLSERALCEVRGKRISMAFQDPFTSLDPIMKVGSQIMETLRIHGVSGREAHSRAVEILSELGMPDAASHMNAYVHEFSGGMRQRVVLAMALVGRPQLLIADEPTTALDVRIQQQVLDLLEGIAARRALSVLLITHDMGVVASFAERVIVMYSGRVVEDAPVDDLFPTPFHPYTRGLLKAIPRVDRDVDRLATVPGVSVAPGARPSGCAFHPRCSLATDPCRGTVPEMREFGLRRVACHHAEQLGASNVV